MSSVKIFRELELQDAGDWLLQSSISEDHSKDLTGTGSNNLPDLCRHYEACSSLVIAEQPLIRKHINAA